MLSPSILRLGSYHVLVELGFMCNSGGQAAIVPGGENSFNHPQIQRAQYDFLFQGLVYGLEFRVLCTSVGFN